MLRNMKVGTKLLAIVVAPVVVLAVIAGIGFQDRLDEASSAEQAGVVVQLVAADSDFVHQLQLERTLSSRFMESDGSSGAEELTQQRAATDEAAERVGALLSATGASTPEMQERSEEVGGRIEGLVAARRTVDALDEQTNVALNVYTQTIDALLSLNSQIAAETEVPEVVGPLGDYQALARAKESHAQLSAVLGAVTTRGVFIVGEFDTLQQILEDQERQLARFLENPDNPLTTELEEALAAEDAETAADLERALLDSAAQGPGAPAPVTADEWVVSQAAWLDAVRGVERTITDRAVSLADDRAFEAHKAARLYIAGTLSGVLLTMLLVSLAARSISRPLTRLTSAARAVAEERLPALVEDLRSPGEHDPAQGMEPIEVGSRDEIGQLAQAINSIQEVTVDVADQQSELLRKGIGEIFVNLARRNQGLLDRQIEFIDELEAHEEDPDQLENLFKLDHLATRMRRNAESLLVLANAEPPRRRARPVPLADVVRVAIGEVEDFTRISLLSLDDVTVGGNVAVDLAHLLSELMENATHFSPPETLVEVVGHRARDAGYVISVSDQGIGMSAEQLAEANERLAHPPLVGLRMDRSLGFTVIGTLASRFGLSIRLAASPAGGVTALVTLPPGVVDDPGGATGEAPAPPPEVSAEAANHLLQAPAEPPTPAAPPEAPPVEPPPVEASPVEAPPVEAPPVEMPQVEMPQVEMPAPPAPPAPPEPSPASLSEALPEGPAFDEGLASLVDQGETTGDQPAETTGDPLPWAPPPDWAGESDPFGEVPPATTDASVEIPGPAPEIDWTQPEPALEATPPPPPPSDDLSLGATLTSDAPPPPPPMPDDEPLFGLPGQVAAPPVPDPETGESEGFFGLPAPSGDGLADLAPAPAENLSDDADAAADASRAPRERLTPGGLVRRSPKTPVPPGQGTRKPVSSSQRSPDQVRAMLSRYRSGLQSGRGSESDTPSDQPEGT